MIFEVKRFDDLSTRELYEILRARADVYTTEEREEEAVSAQIMVNRYVMDR